MPGLFGSFRRSIGGREVEAGRAGRERWMRGVSGLMRVHGTGHGDRTPKQICEFWLGAWIIESQGSE